MTWSRDDLPRKNCRAAEPSLASKVLHFGAAMVGHAANGFALRSQEQIDGLLIICRGCEHYRDGKCNLCGCVVNSGETFRNKLAVASEACPAGKW